MFRKTSKRTDKSVLVIAVKAGKNELHRPSNLTAMLPNDKNYCMWLKPNREKYIQGNQSFYRSLPRQLQEDERVYFCQALIWLLAGFVLRAEILWAVPSFCCVYGRPWYQLFKFMGRSLCWTVIIMMSRTRMIFLIWLPDDEFVLNAYKSQRETFKHATARLCSSRDFVCVVCLTLHLIWIIHLWRRPQASFKSKTWILVLKAIKGDNSFKHKVSHQDW